MARAWSLAAVLVALSACGAPAPPEPTVALAPPPPPPSAAPTGEPAAAQTPDDDFWYRVPRAAETPTVTVPPAQEIRLASGARAILVERREVPIVSMMVSIRRLAPLRAAGADALFPSVLLASPDAAGRSLRERLGPEVHPYLTQDASAFAYSVPPADLEPSLREIVAALRTGPLPEKQLAESRRAILEARAKQRPADRLREEVDAWLFPAGHPGHDPAEGPTAALPKLTVRDLDAYRATIRPEALSFVAVGDVAPDALREALDHALAGFPAAEKPPAPAKPPAAPRLARGSLLIQAPEVSPAVVTLVVPAPWVSSTDVAGDMAEFAFTYLAPNRMARRLQQLAGEAGSIGLQVDGPAGSRLLFIKVEAPSANVPAVARAYLDTASGIARGDVPEDELAASRTKIVTWFGDALDGTRRTAGAFAVGAQLGLPPGWMADRERAVLGLRADDVRRVAEAQARVGEVRLVAMGDVAGLKGDLERMKLGPVVIQKRR